MRLDLNEFLDRVYGQDVRLNREELVGRARDAGMDPNVADMMSHIPPGRYTKAELVPLIADVHRPGEEH